MTFTLTTDSSEGLDARWPIATDVFDPPGFPFEFYTLTSLCRNSDAAAMIRMLRLANALEENNRYDKSRAMPSKISSMPHENPGSTCPPVNVSPSCNSGSAEFVDTIRTVRRRGSTTHMSWVPQLR